MKALLFPLAVLFVLGCTPSSDDDDDATSPTPVTTYTVETKYGRDFIRYATINKTNDVPKLWIQADRIALVNQTGALPDGILIIREEGDPVVGAVYFREKVGGIWEQSNFAPSNPDFTTGPDACGPCHSQPDTLFTLPSLRRFVTSNTVEVITCGEPGNTPCPAGTYD